MIKKAAFLALGVAAALTALSYSKCGSYVRTAWSEVRSGASNQVPPEWEIKRLRQEIAQLTPDMKKHRSAVAEEIVAIENLREEVNTTKERLAQQKKNILKMTEDVESGREFVEYNGNTYKSARVADKLGKDLASYKRSEGELKSKEQLLEAKERSLEAAKEQLASIRDQKQELEVQVEMLEADLKTVRLAETRSTIQLDDSRLGEIKKSIGDLRTQIKVKGRVAEAEAQFANDAMPVEKKAKPAKDVTKEVRDYFSGEGKLAEK